MKNQHPFGHVHVSTHDLPETVSEKERLSMWREVRLSKWREALGIDDNGACLAPEIRSMTHKPFFAEVTVTTLPEVRILNSRRSASQYVVTPKAAKRAESELVILGVLRSGSGELSAADKKSIRQTGTAAVAASDSPWAHYSDGSCTGLVLSRAAIANLVPGVASVIGSTIPADDPALRLLINYIDLLRAAEGLENAEIARSASVHVLDLAALALGARGDAAELALFRGAKAARLAAVRSDVKGMVGHSNLSAEDIAARHRISPRYVRKLFEEAGTSFSSFVMSERLANARRMLADNRCAHLSIAEIAYKSGFGDLSYFNRAFKRQFGATPSEFRDASHTVSRR